MIFDDIAGVRPRLDDALELWPIDVGYDHFTRQQPQLPRRDLTVVWDEPGDGTTHYPARRRATRSTSTASASSRSTTSPT